MPDSELTIVRTYISTIEAELARSALAAAGIEAAIRSDDCGGMRPHMQMAGVELLVRAEDADDATAVLDQGVHDSIPPDAE
jgi:hypothetical protein